MKLNFLVAFSVPGMPEIKLALAANEKNCNERAYARVVLCRCTVGVMPLMVSFRDSH